MRTLLHPDADSNVELQRISNACSKIAAKKPLFRDGMQQRRCLITATNYFEWERMGKQICPDQA